MIRYKTINIGLLICSSILGILIGIFDPSPFFPILIVLLGFYITILFIPYIKEGNHHFIFWLFSLSFLMRIIMAVMLYFILFLKSGTGLLWDSYCYSVNGIKILGLWKSGMRGFEEVIRYLGTRTASGTLGKYDFWNAFVYSITDPNPFSVIFINTFAVSFTVVIVYFITHQLAGSKPAKISSFLVAFWPSLLFWSIQNLKEPITVFLLYLLIWSIVMLRRRFRFFLLGSFILSAWALKEFRLIYFIMFFAGAIPFSIYLSLYKINKSLVLISTFSIAFIVLFSFDFIQQKIIELMKLLFPTVALEGRESLFAWLSKMRYYRTLDASSAFLSSWDYSNPARLLHIAPLAFLISVFAPFPWQVKSMFQIAAMPEMLIYYVLFPFSIAGMRYIYKVKIHEGGILFALVAMAILLFILIEGNVGTLFRHRCIILPGLFIFAGIGMQASLSKKTITNTQGI